MSSSFPLAPRRLRSLFAARRLRSARLIACDLDGTLLNGDDMVGFETARLVHEIVALGVEFVFITARHHYASEPFADDLGLDETIISLDGALTMRPHAPRPLATIEVDPSLAADLAACVEGTDGVDCAFVMADRLRVSRRDMVIPARHHHWNIDVDAPATIAPAGAPVLELLASGTFGAINRVYALAKERERVAGARLRLYESESHDGLWYLEVRNREASKLRALSEYVRTRGIAMREVVAIGDARNDIDFCEKAGYSVAVRNAVDRLRDIADFVTERDCTDDGICEFLHYFIEARVRS